MFVLHVKIKLKPESATATEQFFAGPFKAAIAVQPGFCDVQLLRANIGDDYVLSIAFENEQQQQRWVTTDLHGQVWNEMEKHFEGYSLTTFSAV